MNIDAPIRRAGTRLSVFRLIILAVTAVLACTPIRAAAPEAAITPWLEIVDTAPLAELEEKSLSFISEFCDRVGLDLFYTIDGFIHKDFHTFGAEDETRSFLRGIIETACRHGRHEKWQKTYFTEVFHGYYYIRMLISTYRRDVPPAVAPVLKKLDREIRAAVKTVNVPVTDGIVTPDPVFDSISDRSPERYRFNLSDHALRDGPLSFNSDDYRLIYRGSFSGDSRLQREIWAILTMLEKPDGHFAAARVWRLYYDNLAAGMAPAQAIAGAIGEIQDSVGHLIERGIYRREILSVINWDMGFTADDFIFFSGDYATAALYGDVIYIIRQQEPRRGLPVNEYSFATGYYRNLPYHWLISLKGFWLYSFVDREEYMLPVFVDHAEVAGCDIRAARTRIVPEAIITGRPEKLLRRYRKYFDRENQQLFVLVLDSQNRLMGTLSGQVVTAHPPLDLEPSPEHLPDDIRDYFAQEKIYYLPGK